MYTAETSLGSASEDAYRYFVSAKVPHRWRQQASTTVDYVCTNCGYFERYLTDPDVLEAITEEWQPVSGQ
ncbi:MAG TPA: hypothetical protein VK817_26175 [Trebonia sp.]|nr:hypothetical protein [Trebonia sp.]